MEPSTIVLYAGLLVVLVALIIWVFRKPDPNAQNTIRAFGIEFALNTPALAVMALGIVVIVIGLTQGQKPAPSPVPPAALPPPPSSAPPAAKQLTIYPQIGSDADRGKFASLKATLPSDK